MNLSKKILIKIGSSVLTLPSGLPDKKRIAHIVSQIVELKDSGYKVILVSSGAVAAGRNIININGTLDKISQRQVLASIGQTELMKIYTDFFKKQNVTCSQVLVTKESFRTRQHYLNIKNCLDALLRSNIIPIINENDVVSITELMFTDNDELSGLVASMLDVKSLILLSDVDGIFTVHPDNPKAELIKEYSPKSINLDIAISKTKSEFGRGGMYMKVKVAKEISNLGINVYIGNGKKDHIIKSLLKKHTGTYFKANNRGISNVKKWVAQSGYFSNACIIINDGAKEALLSEKASSLLPVGISEIKGFFEKGDVICIADKNNNSIGLGKVAYDSKKANSYMGKRNCIPLVHYNYLVLN